MNFRAQVNISTTCIRVPVMRAHAESINLEFEKDITVEEVGMKQSRDNCTLLRLLFSVAVV